MKKHITLLFISFLIPFCIGAQEKARKPYDKYYIQFKDKSNTPFSVLNPQKFLSSKSIERRELQQISIDETDLPVSPDYVAAVKKTGAKVIFTTKWLNGAVVFAKGDTLAAIQKLPFVTDTRPIGHYSDTKTKPTEYKKIERKQNYERVENPYGNAFNQIDMLNGVALHDAGYKGKNILCAIFDGGFVKADIMPAFDSLFEKNKIIHTWDFVEQDDYVFEGNNHGTNVLSCMAANMPGLTIGTGPGASFCLFKTEDGTSEMPAEEFNWLGAAERADSIGVYLVNSSLGYTQFDDTTMSYHYQDLTGDIAVVTRAADFAAAKGMLIVNSAGNSGGDDWRYIGTPANADSILTVGATDRNGRRSYFSSYGPTADGRIKPNVAAKGSNSTVASATGYATTTANGTSFSSPIMAGMTAALWDAFPEKSNMDVIQALQNAGNQTNEADNSLGFGIPDVVKAFIELSDNSGLQLNDDLYFKHFNKGDIHIFIGKSSDPVEFELKNEMGKTIFKKEYDKMPSSVNIDMDDQPDGIYTLYIREGIITRRIMIVQQSKHYIEEEKP